MSRSKPCIFRLYVNLRDLQEQAMILDSVYSAAKCAAQLRLRFGAARNLSQRTRQHPFATLPEKESTCAFFSIVAPLTLASSVIPAFLSVVFTRRFCNTSYWRNIMILKRTSTEKQWTYIRYPIWLPSIGNKPVAATTITFSQKSHFSHSNWQKMLGQCTCPIWENGK